MDTKTILSILSILSVAAITKFISDFIDSKRGDNDQKSFNHNKVSIEDFNIRPSLMNSNERIFFEQLKIAAGEEFYIYPQVHLGAIFQPKHYGNFAELNKLNKKIDFVLFDKNTQTPKIAIELDGESHSNYKSFDRDEFVGQIFQKFNIPLVRFNNGNYSSEDIKKEIFK